jgi:tetratricopeptide (TPR) repeat protein
MAPEQMRGQADPRTDIYSLGITLFELLTLQPASEQPQGRLHQTDTSDLMAKLRSMPTEIPFDLQTITLKACAAEPSHRYQSAAELEEDLRRFLEDRPILARRATPIERLYRWGRRNPAIASLSGATLILLMAIVGLLAIYNHRKEKALEVIGRERDRANENLRAKTEALAAVERERTRAEFNLELAIQAFDAVVANIAGRGGSQNILGEIGEETEVSGLDDATLSGADVVLLETLLEFFDRFSAENQTDLSGKSAEARRRVAHIQHRLGRLADAEKSYQLALEAFRTQTNKDPDDTSVIFVQAEILNELLVIAAKRGQMPKAIERYEAARNLLEQSEAIRGTNEGRFALAKTHNHLAAIGFRFGRRPPQRPRSPPFNRGERPLEENFAEIQRTWLQREATANGEALQLLSDLTASSPETTAYQIAYAQALRDEFRIARMRNDGKRADESLSQAIAILDALNRKFPDSDNFKYELALTLSLSGPGRPNEMQRFVRSMKLSDELIAKHPEEAEYQVLRAQSLDRIAMMQRSTGRLDRAEDSLRQAVAIHQKLADRFPDILLYQFNFLQSIQRLAEFHIETKRPELAKEDLRLALSELADFQKQSRLFDAIQPLMLRIRERLKSIE